MTKDYQVVVVGTSAGGIDALPAIVAGLPADFPLPVAIVQHRQADTDDFLAKYLDERSPLCVKEADDKEPLQPGRVYLAPGGYHLLIEQDATFALSLDERLNFCRPSIDVLFDSAVEAFTDKVIGVVLTGANLDGSQGLKHIGQRGGTTIVQDPEDAAAECMPREAIRAANVDHVLPLEEIAPLLVRCCSAGGIRENHVLAEGGR